MPARTEPAVLQLCLRRLHRGDSLPVIAMDAKISIRTIYRAVTPISSCLSFYVIYQSTQSRPSGVRS